MRAGLLRAEPVSTFFILVLSRHKSLAGKSKLLARTIRCRSMQENGALLVLRQIGTVDRQAFVYGPSYMKYASSIRS